MNFCLSICGGGPHAGRGRPLLRCGLRSILRSATYAVVILGVFVCPGLTAGAAFAVDGVLADDAGPAAEPVAPRGVESTDAAAPASEENEQSFRYVTRVRNAPSPEIKKLMQEVSLLRAKQNKPVSATAVLVRRSRSDVFKLERVLESEGYYEGTVELRIDEKQTPVEVLLLVSAGPLFVFDEFDVMLTDASPLPADEPLLREISRIEIGKPARGADVVRAERQLLAGFAEIGQPFAVIDSRDVEVDHATDTVDVHFRIDPGPKVTFGEIIYEGLSSVDEQFVRNRLPWKEGEQYSAAAIANGRKALQATGLFGTVKIRHAAEWNPDHSVPIYVYLDESDFRTFGVGVEYNSDTGAGANAFWEHRNLRGKAERLRLRADVSEIGWGAELQWRKPDFWKKNFILEYNAGYAIEDPDAYHSEIASTSVGLEVPVGGWSSLKGGVALEYGPVESAARDDDGQRRQDENFTLVSLPLRFRRTTVENVLEPFNGTRFEWYSTPYASVFGSDLTFWSNRGTYSFYLPLPFGAKNVLANRVSAGSIMGESRAAIPANKRFFAGGGGSIRGYEYQKVGPLDDREHPIGGRSLFEVGTELRIRILDWLGIVAFFEGGSVFASELPDLEKTLRWGTGGGLRFYTAVGPLRVDVGTPVNPRSGVDDAVQFYISLGEAY